MKLKNFWVSRPAHPPRPIPAAARSDTRRNIPEPDVAERVPDVEKEDRSWRVAGKRPTELDSFGSSSPDIALVDRVSRARLWTAYGLP
jgi:hypothetical protein